jgi:YD repeat-containing protein
LNDTAPGAGQHNFTYDLLDRLTKESTPRGTVSYAYDVLGRRTSLKINNQRSLSYSYDDNDRLTTITEGNETLREAAGEVVARKADGTPWDHVHELRDAQRGLLNRIDSIKRQLGNGKVSDAQRSALQRELGEASKLLDKTEGYLPR